MNTGVHELKKQKEIKPNQMKCNEIKENLYLNTCGIITNMLQWDRFIYQYITVEYFKCI